MSTLTFPSLFIGHGGGPMPLLNDPAHAPLVRMWKAHVAAIKSAVGLPLAIAVISAHYNTAAPAIGACTNPEMIYDYGGFPAAAYKVKYPAPGSPAVAQRASDLLKDAGIKHDVDTKRGYDHGVFVPLLSMFPEAKIPIVPISVMHTEDPAAHIALGRALAPLRREGVLIIGSGMSSHNFATFSSGTTERVGGPFHDALTAVVDSEAAGTADAARLSKLEGFLRFPNAREAQLGGQAEHFMPLLVTAGAGVSADGTTAGGRVAWRGAMFGAATVHVWFGEEDVIAAVQQAQEKILDGDL